MNSLHFHAWSEQKNGSRGRLRDALTLFDECGVIVFSNNLEILTSLAGRRLAEAFQNDAFGSEVQITVCGHAMLEKYLSPYKSMTAKALLLHVDSDFLKLPRQDRLTRLDELIARKMLDRTILTQPASLAPLPLAGIPGWWPVEKQNDEFYDDAQVFRAPPTRFTPAPVYDL